LCLNLNEGFPNYVNFTPFYLSYFFTFRRERKRTRSRSPRDRDRDRERDRERYRPERERSPERERRPPLKYKYWDVPPSGYEHMTPKEYKELQGI